MRTPFVALAVGSLGLAFLVPVGAQAAPPEARSGGDLVVGWDSVFGGFTVTAAPGLAPFGEAEEFVITRVTTLNVTFSIVDGSARLTTDASALLHCDVATFVDTMTCTADTTRFRVGVDMWRASVPTTTVVSGNSLAFDLDFVGGSGPDYVQGGKGHDRISGGGGADDLYGGAGDDQIDGLMGDDNLDGEAGRDRLDGGPGNDDVVGDGHIDVDEGEKGVPDVIRGGPGADSLDSRDGVKDTLVTCDNAPGTGAIIYDVDLDWPYDCPVTLRPTVPQSVRATTAENSLTVNWDAPEFDGNAPLDYLIERTAPGGSVRQVIVEGVATSWTETGVDPGTYTVKVRASNAAGTSDWTNPVPVTVLKAGIEKPTMLLSVFDGFRSGSTIAWVGTAQATSYELAMRTRRPTSDTWRPWVSLPIDIAAKDTKLCTTSFQCLVDFSADLKSVQGNVYQFRVRSVRKGTKASAWAVSGSRFAGNLQNVVGSFEYDSMNVLRASVVLPGPAWRYNVTLKTFEYAVQPNLSRFTSIDFVRQEGQRYTLTVPPPNEMRGQGCYVGVSYVVTGIGKTELAKGLADCPGFRV